MSDLSITPANVKPVNDENFVGKTVTAGGTITAGKSVYLDTSDAKWKLADANASVTTAGKDGLAIALNGAADGQPLEIQTAGDIDIGGTIALRSVYTVSSTAGALQPHGDISAGEYTSIVGLAITTSRLRLAITVADNSTVVP